MRNSSIHLEIPNSDKCLKQKFEEDLKKLCKTWERLHKIQEDYIQSQSSSCLKFHKESQKNRSFGCMMKRS